MCFYVFLFYGVPRPQKRGEVSDMRERCEKFVLVALSRASGYEERVYLLDDYVRVVLDREEHSTQLAEIVSERDDNVTSIGERSKMIKLSDGYGIWLFTDQKNSYFNVIVIDGGSLTMEQLDELVRCLEAEFKTEVRR